MFIEHVHSVTRNLQKRETRQRILEVARAHFVEAGYAATTIRSIASAAGVAVGSIHAHFPDKSALLSACLYEDIARAQRRIWQTLDHEATLQEQLGHCAGVLYESYARHPELSRAMLTETLFPKSATESDELLSGFLARVRGLFDEAKRRGEITLQEAHIPAAAEAFFCLYICVLLGGLAGSYGQARSSRARARLWRQKFDQLLQVQLQGVGAAADSGAKRDGRRRNKPARTVDFDD